MGNALCGHAVADGRARSKQQHGGGSAAQPAAATTAPTAAAHTDDAETALIAARAELDVGAQQCFSEAYTVQKIIGHGAYCKVQLCVHNTTSKEYAVKVVQKAAGNLKQRAGIIKEVAIMRLLQDHPCAVQLQGVYEDEAAYYLVMELCTDGELFDQIVTRGHFSEQDAVGIMRSLLDFVAYAHSKHVVHRDYKPENLMLTSKGGSTQLKVIDFGTSEFCKPGQRLHKKFGTPYYCAPEVLNRDYAHAADVWSAGVIMFILLSGYPPFSGSDDARILERVQQGSYSFAAKEWECVSEAAKAMIRSMLALDQSQRSTAAALLTHPWLTMEPSARKAATPSASAVLGTHIMRRLRGFAKLSHMKRLALVVVAQSLSDQDVSRLRSLFMSMDKDDDGRISAEDLHTALYQVNVAVEQEELCELFMVADISGQGLIDYEDFIAAMLDTQRVAQRVDAVRRSFETLDRDGDGYISVQDLAQVLSDDRLQRKGTGARRCSWQLAEQLVAEVDLDKDGTVSFEEFRNMMCLVQEPVAA